MKKTLLIFSLSIFWFANSFSQPVPNPGFENWVTYPLYEEPTGWTSPNGAYPVYTVTKSTDICSGTYSVQVRNDTFINTIGDLDTLAGVVETGTNYVTGQLGFGDTIRVTNMTVCMKYTRAGNDSAELYIELRKFNPISGMSQKITTNYCYRRYGQSSATFSQKTVPITYLNSTDIPDTAIIVFSPSASNSQASVTPGSTLWIDDVVLNFNVGVNENSGDDVSVHVLPNPAKDEIYFSSLPSDAKRIRILDITGREIENVSIVNPETKVNLKNWSKGIYLYQISTVENKLLTTGKISVVE